MFKNYSILAVLFVSFALSQYDYTLEDINPSSIYHGEDVGTSYFPDQVTLHYFGHYNWGTCTARFGQLNDLYEDLLSDGYGQVKLIGIGKSVHMSSSSNWINGNDASVCADNSPYPIWIEWGAAQRDLYVLNHEGDVVFHENVTGQIPSNLSSLIIDLIGQIPDDSLLGDINGDEILNVLDVVIMVNIALGVDTDDSNADMNGDSVVNVLDIVILVGIILG